MSLTENTKRHLQRRMITSVEDDSIVLDDGISIALDADSIERLNSQYEDGRPAAKAQAVSEQKRDAEYTKKMKEQLQLLQDVGSASIEADSIAKQIKK